MRLLCLALISFFVSSCSVGRSCPEETSLASISIIDRNGLSETINAKERLLRYEEVDFLCNQPYQKILRVYERDCNGDITACVTSYYPNGQIKQYLELANARAFGKYKEWYPNGLLKLEANVIGGMADITPSAQKTWLFDGLNRTWDEEGFPAADIYYSKGEMEGITTYFHPNGAIWKTISYHNDKIEGYCDCFFESGELLQRTHYCQDLRDGPSVRYWQNGREAAREEYINGLLQEGFYFDQEGLLISQIHQGEGYRAIFGKEKISELHHYSHGAQEGEVKEFDCNGRLVHLYHLKEGIKQGEEIEYYLPLDSCSFSSSDSLPVSTTPKMLIYWHEGKIQGMMKTWYDNGQLESQREMSNNCKNGLLTAWYRDGSLMLIEEYDRDKLVRGEYFKKGNPFPLSQVTEGKGSATLFDAEGHFVRKITYSQGLPSKEG